MINPENKELSPPCHARLSDEDPVVTILVSPLLRENLVISPKLANWLKGSGFALLCLRPLVLITGKYNF